MKGIQEEINRKSEELGKTEPASTLHFQVENLDGVALQKMDEAARNKPEVDYNFDDWNARAFYAWNKNEYDDAARYWRAAAHVAAASNYQVTQSLNNAGLAFQRLNRREDAIAVYTELVSIYGNETDDFIRGQVILALLNKAMLLTKVGDSAGALNECDKIVSCYGDATEVWVRPLVAHAHNIKGYILLCRAKENWINESARLDDLHAAAQLFTQAEKETDNKPMVWGNQAYNTFLLGEEEGVRPLLKQALQKGGDWLYKETLLDLGVHPVPLDAGFRALLEEVWAEVKPKNS